MGEVGEASVPATGNGIKSNAYGEEEVTVKLHQVRSDGDTIFSQSAHGKPTWHLCLSYKGG